MLDKDTLPVITAIGALLTPILLALLGGGGWLVKRRSEASQAKQDQYVARIRELEDKLRDDRIAAYNAILEPFLFLFTTEAAFAMDKKYKGKDKNEIAVARMLSVEYRHLAFKMTLIANDEVVRSFNRLMQFFYRMENDPREIEVKTAAWLAITGDLLLAIRKSMGNESSNLSRWDMIEWFMSETDKMKMAHEA